MLGCILHVSAPCVGNDCNAFESAKITVFPRIESAPRIVVALRLVTTLQIVTALSFSTTTHSITKTRLIVNYAFYDCTIHWFQDDCQNRFALLNALMNTTTQ